jgi:hypothetical protein
MGSLGGLGDQFWSTLFGAVVGAIMGGLISVGIQIWGARATRKDRAEAKRQEDLATALSVTVQVIKMLSYVNETKVTIEEALSRLSEAARSDAWQVGSPFISAPPNVIFTKEEAAFILTTRVDRLLLTALELADRYNDLIHMVAVYSERREFLTSLLPVDSVAGSQADSSLDPATQKILRPQMAQLNMLIDDMAKASATAYDMARQIFGLLKAHCEEKFGKEFPKLELEP